MSHCCRLNATDVSAIRVVEEVDDQQTRRNYGRDTGDLQSLNPQSFASIGHPELQRHRDATDEDQRSPQGRRDGWSVVAQPLLAPSGPGLGE